jgi:hypothetical protein
MSFLKGIFGKDADKKQASQYHQALQRAEHRIFVMRLVLIDGCSF